MSEPFYKSYVMNESEAEITAKWELGIRNLAQPLALALLGAIMLIEVARRLIKLPLPDWSFIATDAVAVMIFVTLLYAIDKRVKECAASIAKRRIELAIAGDRITLTEGGRRVYCCEISGISRVEAGAHVVRITAETGAVCVPHGALPPELIPQLRERLGKTGFKVYNWM